MSSVWTRAGHFVLLRALARKGRASPRPPAEDREAAAVAAAEAEAMARASAAKGAAGLLRLHHKPTRAPWALTGLRK